VYPKISGDDLNRHYWTRRPRLTKKKYAEGLRGIFKKGKICERCPLGSGMINAGLPALSTRMCRCKLCFDFINLRGDHTKSCPCGLLGEKKARIAATAALERWDKRTHKWQKKGGK
jgi:hypothetical protein